MFLCTKIWNIFHVSFFVGCLFPKILNPASCDIYNTTCRLQKMFQFPQSVAGLREPEEFREMKMEWLPNLFLYFY